MDKKHIHLMQETEQHLQGRMEQIKWDDLKVFYMVVISESFRTAAKNMSWSLNAIRSRVDSLEAMCNEILLIRHAKGVTPTEKGKTLFNIAKNMADASKELNSRFLDSGEDVSGDVLLAATEGLGSFWLMPKLRQLRQSHPKLMVRLRCDMQAPDLAKHEVDVSIQLEPPEHPGLIIQTLGYMHLVPYASHSYLKQYGQPKIPLEPPHGFVQQVAPQVLSDAWGDRVDEAEKSLFTVVQTNTSSAHFYAVASGLGVGILPTYAKAVTRTVVPVDLGLPPLKRKIYLAYHPQARRVRKIDVVLDWVRKAFDPEKFPWFGDEFIHPNELEEHLERDNIISLFENFDSMVDL
ncbi:MAG: LysR family transcriptional regulator [Sphingomonadales bacterium]|jgi:DNA-binding transcriptional LysR family regulator